MTGSCRQPRRRAADRYFSQLIATVSVVLLLAASTQPAAAQGAWIEGQVLTNYGSSYDGKSPWEPSWGTLEVRAVRCHLCITTWPNRQSVTKNSCCLPYRQANCSIRLYHCSVCCSRQHKLLGTPRRLCAAAPRCSSRPANICRMHVLPPVRTHAARHLKHRQCSLTFEALSCIREAAGAGYLTSPSGHTGVLPRWPRATCSTRPGPCKAAGARGGENLCIRSACWLPALS